MTTQEVANRYYEMIRTGDYAKVQDDLYSPEAASIEPENDSDLPIKTVGIPALREKERAYNELIEERHSGFCNPPIVSSYHFACVSGMDVTIKGKGRKMKEQIGVFEVENGKIVQEQFFYNDFL